MALQSRIFGYMRFLSVIVVIGAGCTVCAAVSWWPLQNVWPMTSSKVLSGKTDELQLRSRCSESSPLISEDKDNHSWDSFTRVSIRSKAGMLTTARTKRASMKNVPKEDKTADWRKERGQVLPHDRICGQGMQKLLPICLTYKLSWKQAPVLFISFVSSPLPFRCTISTSRTMHVSSVS